MATVLIVDGRAPQELSPGRLNHALAERAAAAFEAAGWRVLRTEAAARFDVDAEIAKHQDADLILFQFPVHWMGAPWPLKKYQDEVYTPAMDGRLASGDGRSSAAPTRNYGMGGALGAARYMLSVTLNAPREAFGDPDEPFFAGRSLDDMLLPVHLVARFLGLRPMESFAAHDVLKNPQIETDFARFDAHLERAIAVVEAETSGAAA